MTRIWTCATCGASSSGASGSCVGVPDRRDRQAIATSQSRRLSLDGARSRSNASSRASSVEDVNRLREPGIRLHVSHTYVELARAARSPSACDAAQPQERSIDIRRGTWQERFASLFGDGSPPADEARAAERQAEDRKDAIVTAFMKALIVEPVRNSRIVRISFDSPDRELAARVANAVGRAFIELNLERRMDASSYAKTFLEERLEQVRARLEDSERKLVGFARKQEIVTVGEKQTLSTARLDQVQQELNKVELERVKLESAWKQLQTRIRRSRT